MIDEQRMDNNFSSASKKWSRTYDNDRKITIGQGDYYTTGCLLHYPYFKENYKVIAIDISKQQAQDVDLKSIEQINFTVNLYGPELATTFLFIEEAIRSILDFSQETVRVL